MPTKETMGDQPRKNFSSVKQIRDSGDPDAYDTRLLNADDKQHYNKVITREEQAIIRLKSKSKVVRPEPRVQLNLPNVTFASSVLKLSGAEKMWQKPETADYVYHRLKVVGSRDAVTEFIQILIDVGYGRVTSEDLKLDNPNVAWTLGSYQKRLKDFDDELVLVKEANRRDKLEREEKEDIPRVTLADVISTDYGLLEKVTAAVDAYLKETKGVKVAGVPRQRSEEANRKSNRAQITRKYNDALRSEDFFYDPSQVTDKFIKNRRIDMLAKGNFPGNFNIYKKLAVPVGKTTPGLIHVRVAMEEILESGDQVHTANERALATKLLSDLDGLERMLGRTPAIVRSTSRSRLPRHSESSEISSSFTARSPTGRISRGSGSRSPSKLPVRTRLSRAKTPTPVRASRR